MKIKHLFINVLIMCISLSAIGQVVNVDPYTGAGSVNIPLWVVGTKSLSYPIGMSYSARGIPGKSSPGNLGIGWYLQAESQISRQVKGLPDDYKNASGTDSRYGWLHNNAAQDINAITPPTTGIAELTNQDFTALNALGGFTGTGVMQDTEPDIFYINVPGLSTSFVFDHNGNITFSGPTNISLEKTMNASGQITSFQLTTGTGVEYLFEANFESYIQTETNDESEIKYFKRKYFLYKDILHFVASWRLVSITAITGEKLDFEYKETSPATFSFDYDPIVLDNLTLQEEPINVFVYNELTGDYDKKEQYVIKTYVPPSNFQLIKIQTTTQRVEFSDNNLAVRISKWNNSYQITKTLIGGVHIYDNLSNELIKKYEFDYAALGEGDNPLHPEGYYSHIFLKSITEYSDANGFAPYSFQYYGISLDSDNTYLSESTSHNDPYGFQGLVSNHESPRKLYVYPALQGADKVRHSPIGNYANDFFVLDGKENKKTGYSKIAIGSLKTITLPSGGENTIIYEPNLYYDELSEVNVYGGGLRVARTEVYDGIDHANDIITKYSYQDQTGKSTGKLVYKPLFYMQLPYYWSSQTNNVVYNHEMVSAGLSANDILKRTLIRTDWDITREQRSGSSVVYKQSSVIVAGTGKTVYDFKVPTDYQSTTTANGSVPKTSMAMAYPSQAYNNAYLSLPALNDQYGVPGIRQPSDVSTNGNLENVTLYDENGNMVSKTTNQYQTIGTSTKVHGIKLFRGSSFISYTIDEQVGSSPPIPTNYQAAVASFLFSDYELNMGQREVVSSSEQISYDPSGAGSPISNNTSYAYNSNAHFYPTSTTSVNDEGTSKVYYKYPEDYTVGSTESGQDEQSWAIHNLIDKNEVAAPIEVVSTKTIGTTETVTSAVLSLMKYNPAFKRSLSKETHIINTPVAYSSFTTSTVSHSGGNYTFNKDNLYEKVASVESYDNDNNAISMLSRDLSKQGMHYDPKRQQAKLVINGALAEDVLFSDFESITLQDFFQQNGSSTTGRYGSKGLQLTAGSANKIYATVNYAEAKSYVFSTWIKATTAGLLTIDLSDVNSATSTKTISYANTSDKWIYHEVIVPSANLSGDISIDVYSNNSIDIDDVVFYPESAAVSYHLYGKSGVKLMETGTDGTSTYYAYDDLNRLILIKDKDENIIKRFTYNQQGDDSFWEPKITWSSNYVNETITFSATPEFSAATYKWRIIPRTGNWANDETNARNFSTASPESSTKNFTTSNDGTWFVNVQITQGGVTKQLQSVRSINIVNKPLRAELTANRPELIDICYPEPTTPLIVASPTPNTVCLQVNATGGSGSYDYQWEREEAYSGTGNTLISGNNNSSFCDTDYYAKKYRCTVTDSNDSNNFVFTDWMTFETYQSDSACIPIDPSN